MSIDNKSYNFYKQNIQEIEKKQKELQLKGQDQAKNQFLKDRKEQEEQNKRYERINKLLKDEEQQCYERMKEYEMKMTDVIDRSRMILNNKVKKMEYQNKIISDKVELARQNSYQDFKNKAKSVANKEEKIITKIVGKDETIRKLKEEVKRENDEKQRCMFNYS